MSRIRSLGKVNPWTGGKTAASIMLCNLGFVPLLIVITGVTRHAMPSSNLP